LQAWGVDDLVTYLQRTGYRPDADENALGTYTIQGNTSISGRRNSPSLPEVTPWPSNSTAGSFELFARLGGGSDMGTAEIEPELITKPVRQPARKAPPGSL